MQSHVAALIALLGERRLLSVPGCWDGITALLIEQAEFPAAFLTGAGLAMGRFGRPDIGLTTATEVAETVSAIRDRIAIPLIVDGDTGFGNALTLARAVRGFERAGASAIQIEDQGFPKRCGHMAGKTVVPVHEAIGRISAAVETRVEMLVVARTDAVAVEGINSALDRADAYLEAGADLIFVEGPRTESEILAIAERFAGRVPLMYNLVEGGTSPIDDIDLLAQLGFAIALHPLLLMHGLVAAAPAWLAHLRQCGSTRGLALADLATMNCVTGADPLIDWGDRHGG